MKTVSHVPVEYSWLNSKETIPTDGRTVLVRVKGKNKDYTCFGFYVHPKTVDLIDFLQEYYFDDGEWEEYADVKAQYSDVDPNFPEYCWMKEGWWSYNPHDEENSYPLGEIIGWNEVPR